MLYLYRLVRYVAGTDETDENIHQMEPHERKYRGKDVALKTHEGAATTRKRRTGVTCARCCSTVRWITPTTRAVSSLQYSTSATRVPLVPRFAELCIEKKVRLLVGEIAERNEEKEGW